MIFEDWELAEICKVLQKSDSISKTMIALKIEELRKTSKNKRYTLRTTDWLSESARNRKRKIKNNTGSLI